MSGQLHELGVAEISRAVRERKLSSVELTQHLLKRIDADAALGSFLALDHERSLSQAQAADTRAAVGEGGALNGVPLAHKDIFVTDFARTGLASTAGSKMLAGYASPFDATVVARLNAGQQRLRGLDAGQLAQRDGARQLGHAEIGHTRWSPAHSITLGTRNRPSSTAGAVRWLASR